MGMPNWTIPPTPPSLFQTGVKKITSTNPKAQRSRVRASSSREQSEYVLGLRSCGQYSRAARSVRIATDAALSGVHA
jgi:hypothetical protein